MSFFVSDLADGANTDVLDAEPLPDLFAHPVHPLARLPHPLGVADALHGALDRLLHLGHDFGGDAGGFGFDGVHTGIVPAAGFGSSSTGPPFGGSSRPRPERKVSNS